MPSGKTHEFFNIVLLPPVLTVLKPEEIISFTVGYLFSTFLLSPDLDLPQSKPSQRWGALKILWSPYQSLIPHRNVISHFPVISSLIRLIYLVLPLSLAIFIIFKVIDEVFFEGALTIWWLNTPVNENLLTLLKIYAFNFTYGVIVSDTIHIGLDILSTSYKNLKGKFKKKMNLQKS